MSKMILTNEQIKKLRKISKKFTHIENFEISLICESGIGPAMFCEFNDNGIPISIDITDVSNW